ncbi:MAG TPA: MFS transporter [Polyangiaceae bacterium]|nr:MFS transporter [Polyangiaceae bacterium]
MQPDSSRPNAVLGRRRAWLLLLSYAGFVSLGLPDTVLGAAWPAVRTDLGLRVDTAGSVVLVTTAGVVLSSMLSGRVRGRWGTAAVLVASTLLAALGLLTSAAAPSFAYLLLAAVSAGLGGGAIDACLNDYVARHHSARHMSWLHASWGIGASLAPAVVSGVLASGASWRVAYGSLGAVESLLALAFWATRRSWGGDAAGAEAHAGPAAGAGSRWPQRASVLLFFCYGGLEAGVGLWAATLLTETRGTSRALAGGAVALYWGALCAGRFVIGARADAWGPARVLRVSARAAPGCAVLLAAPGTPTWLWVAALACLGASLASIYPLTMHDTPRRFGPEGARLVGYQVAATSLGVASLPWLIGAIAASVGLAMLPVLLCALAVCVTWLERERRRPAPA